jgi:hypothetical protein
MVTPGVELEIVAETLVAVEHPSFLIATVKSMHSLASMTPIPLPPEIVAELKIAFGVPLRQAFSVVISPSVIVTVNGPAGLQR